MLRLTGAQGHVNAIERYIPLRWSSGSRLAEGSGDRLEGGTQLQCSQRLAHDEQFASVFQKGFTGDDDGTGTRRGLPTSCQITADAIGQAVIDQQPVRKTRLEDDFCRRKIMSTAHRGTPALNDASRCVEYRRVIIHDKHP